MDDLRRLCVRMMGEGQGAASAEQAGRQVGEDRLGQLRAALAACHDLAPATADAPAGEDAARDFRAAVAHELQQAVGGMSERHRAALALRDLLGLSHADTAVVLDGQPAEVAVLLAHARIALRDRLRSSAPPLPACPERERSLRTIALRQDGEDVPEPDQEWVIEHLGLCRGCARAHAAMLEGAACYRAWQLPAGGEAASAPEPTATAR